MARTEVNYFDNDDSHEFYDSNDFFDNQRDKLIADEKKKEFRPIINIQADGMNDQIVIEACLKGNLVVIEEFLDAGHGVNDYLISNWPLLIHAASVAHTDIVRYLLNSQADPNLHDEGFTALMALSKSTKNSPEERLQCLQYLIEAGANINAKNKMKETALMYACKEQEIDFILLLLEYVDHINFADSEQNTALFYAVSNNRYDLTKILIENGADIGWLNFSGLRPYDIAVTKGFDELLPLLEITCEDEQNNVDTDCLSSWIDMFPTMYKIDKDHVDNDVASILYGMGLENYKHCFRGIDLRTFLKLKEEDLERLGIDMSVHRRRFVEELLRFHNYTWNNSLIKINNSKTFTSFDAIKALGSINKQLSIMSSSMRFSKNCLDSIGEDERKNMTDEEVQKLEEGIRELEMIASKIQEATIQVKHVANSVDEKNSHIASPTFIAKKDKKKNTKWIALTLIAIVGIYFFRTHGVRKLCRRRSSRSWRNIFSLSLLD